jgi:hypothetical protein
MTSTGATTRDEFIAVGLTCGYFALAGLLELGTSLVEARPPLFWPIWDAVMRACGHAILALGLYRRLAVCRTIAMVYCVTIVILYAFVVAFALAQEPFQYPASVVIQSLFHVPTGVLVLRYLRTPEAARAFQRRLLRGRPKPPNPTDRACSDRNVLL